MQHFKLFVLGYPLTLKKCSFAHSFINLKEVLYNLIGLKFSYVQTKAQHIDIILIKALKLKNIKTITQM